MNVMCLVLCVQCSQTCGAGVMERRVECVNADDVTSHACSPSTRPESHATCRLTDCESVLSSLTIQHTQCVLQSDNPLL